MSASRPDRSTRAPVSSSHSSTTRFTNAVMSNAPPRPPRLRGPLNTGGRTSWPSCGGHDAVPPSNDLWSADETLRQSIDDIKPSLWYRGAIVSKGARDVKQERRLLARSRATESKSLTQISAPFRPVVCNKKRTEKKKDGRSLDSAIRMSATVGEYPPRTIA